MSGIDGWILVVGYGSIGRRHYQNLKALDVEDVRLLRGKPRPQSFESPEGAVVYHELDTALADGPAVVVVANPTSLHVLTARAALEVGASVLLEKPVDADLKAARSLLAAESAASGVCSMAYCFRYHPLYRKLHDVIASGKLGRVFHAHTWQGSFLPGWHPWEDYHTSYAALPDMGGGVVRTLDHDLDMLRWTLGQPTEVLASAGPLSGIGTEAEDTADMIFRFPGRVQACAHLCYARQDYSRGMWAVGEAGSVNLDWNAGTLHVTEGNQVVETVTLPDDFDLNSIYVDMARDALDGFAETPSRATAPLADGVAGLEMALGALVSSRDGKVVSLKGA